MPANYVKTVRQLLYYQYAKIISESAHWGKTNYGMITTKYKQLLSGEIHWSSSVREWLKEKEKSDECIYCGEKTDLTTEHILPKCCGGEDIPENVIRVCKHCNSSKGGKRLYEWSGYKNKDRIDRIAEGKYLKYLYSLHEKQGTLDMTPPELCQWCNMQGCCEKNHSVEKLTVFCLEGCFHKKCQ